ncbi:MAG: TolC family protein [Myxococcota bacterium]
MRRAWLTGVAGAVFGLALAWTSSMPEAAEPAPPAAEAALPDRVDWPALARLALARSPRLAAVARDIDVAHSDAIAADRYPNPTLGYELDQVVGGANPGNLSVHALTVQQPLMIGGQRHARHAAATSAVGSAEAALEVSKAGLLHDLRLAWIDAAANDAEAAVLKAGVARLDAIVAVVRERATLGHASLYDVRRVETEVDGMKQELATTEADAARRARPSARCSASRAGRRWPAARSTSRCRAVSARPAVRTGPAAPRSSGRRCARWRRPDAEVDLARAERWPDLVVTAGATIGQDATTAGAIVGLAWELPVFDSGRGAVARARAELLASRARRDATHAEAEAQRSALAAAVAARKTALEQFDASFAPHAEEVAGLAEDAYKGGVTSLLDLLDAVRGAIDARREHLDRLAALRRAEAELAAAEGGLDTAP